MHAGWAIQGSATRPHEKWAAIIDKDRPGDGEGTPGDAPDAGSPVSGSEESVSAGSVVPARDEAEVLDAGSEANDQAWEAGISDSGSSTPDSEAAERPDAGIQQPPANDGEPSEPEGGSSEPVAAGAPLVADGRDVDRRFTTLDARLSSLDSRLSFLDSRRRWPRFVAILIATVVGLVAAFAVGRITASDDEDSALAVPIAVPVPSSTTTTTLATTVAPGTAAPTVPPSTMQRPNPATTPPPTMAPAPAQTVAEIAANVGGGVVQIVTREASGSGIIYDPRGFILTAAHVVATEDDFVTVRLADGRALSGEIVGRHDATDVAVIKVDPVDGLQVIELAPTESLVVGELAIAFGYPHDLGQTVTIGIVSAVDRLVDGVIMVQTDAAINPGSSGGPLVDGLGRVVGIHKSIVTLSGGNEGVGFAISIDLAILVAEQLVAGEPVRLAYLGVSVSTTDSDPAGALVEEVVSGSAADLAGLVEGDLVVRVGGRLIIDRDALSARVIKKRPGDTLELEIVRDGETIFLSAVLGARTPE